MGKQLRLGLILLSAAGIPYVWFNEPLADQAKAQFSSWFGGEAQPALQLSGTAATAASAAPTAVPPVLTGSGVDQLEDVLRFDVTVPWIMQRWSRVSTVRAVTGLEGIRVPLVTGTQTDDLAGSLTYYFDRQHQVQRITFEGTTGDEKRLVDLLTRRFQLEAAPTLGAGLYLVRWNRRPTSVLRVAHAPVVRAEAPLERLQIRLELNRPDVGYQLSREFQALLEQDRHAQRW